MNYFIADGNNRRGPFPVDQLMAQGLRAETLVWCEGMAEWQPAGSVAELRSILGPPGVGPMVPPVPGYTGAPGPMGPVPFDRGAVNSKRVASGVLGILIGGLGIHKFVLGMTGPGLIMLLVTLCTCGFGAIAMGPIGLIEGIIYLTKSDEEFYQQYMVEKRAWF